MRALLKYIFVTSLYILGIVMVFFTVFKEAAWGLYFLTVLIPQPNIKYALHEFPLGKDLFDIFFIALVAGMLLQKIKIQKSPNTWLIAFFLLFSYIALWNSSIRFNLPLPVSTENILLLQWKNYAEMILLYFLAFLIIRSEPQQKKMLLLMCLVLAFIAFRSYVNFVVSGDIFSWNRRDSGPFSIAGLNANHYGSFIVFYCSVFLGLSFFEQIRTRKLLYLAAALLGIYPLLFSYSRGAYLAAFVVLLLFGILKKRMLIAVAVVLFFAWQTLLPTSVVDRIMMTEETEGKLEQSAGGRLELWQIAIDKFKESPVYGIGYGGYALSAGGTVLQTGKIVPENVDTHNYWLKTLSEQGLIGFLLLVLVMIKSFMSGWRLFKQGKTDFIKGLGFGFMGCVLALSIANIFGDRWTFFELGGYFWILWGLVDRGILLSKPAAIPVVSQEKIEREEELVGQYYS